MIRKAAEFAAKAHEGAVRKGSRIPYIYHPMEAAVIVAQMTEDEEVIAAAYLHDVLEDTAVTAEQLEKESLSWRERKQVAIEHLKTASREEKILVLGDKLSNMRSTARDYMAEGEQVWQRFNEKRRECHQWYMAGMLEGLKELEDTTAYQEFCQLFHFVYGA